MLIVFVILILASAIILGTIILVQNPKGGGLSGSFGGLGNQLMGVKQTTDVLEKGTWVFAGLIGVLCILSSLFIPSNTGGSSKDQDLINKTSANPPQTQSPVNAPSQKP
jgi:preprotein translocase subunit SecG